MTRQSIAAGLGLYITAVGVAVLGHVAWQGSTFLHAVGRGEAAQIWQLVIALLPYLLFVCFLLIPWWRMGIMTRTLGYAIGMPVCAYVIVGFLIVDMMHFRQKIPFQCFLLSGLLAQLVRVLIPVVDEIRSHGADVCRRYLREKHGAKGNLVEQFILEVEGEDHDVTIWNQFVEVKDPEMLKRLDRVFESWLRKAGAPARTQASPHRVLS